MLKASVLVVVLFVCAIAGADDRPKPIGTPPPPTPPTNLPPKPDKGPIRYAALKDGFDRGNPTSEAILTGEWKLVAQATNSECGDFLVDSTNLDGLKNEDGSAYATFEFARYADNTQTSNPLVFGVKLLNLGKLSENQGPYAVDEKEPQFAQWLYSYTGIMKDKAWITYACRAIGAKNERLICASKPGYADLTSAEAKNRKRCMDSGLGIMAAYKKIVAP